MLLADLETHADSSSPFSLIYKTILDQFRLSLLLVLLVPSRKKKQEIPEMMSLRILDETWPPTEFSAHALLLGHFISFISFSYEREMKISVPYIPMTYTIK